MVKQPASNDNKNQLRRAIGEAGLVDDSKAGELIQPTKDGNDLARSREGAVGTSHSFRTDDHKLLEAIGAPSTAASLSGPVPRSARQPDRPNAIAAAADIGKLVRDARKTMGMNQQRFADLAGVGRRFVSELESGKASLEIGRVLAVCKAAGIDLFAQRR
jgi:y4mF family transcriptional regulator